MRNKLLALFLIFAQLFLLGTVSSATDEKTNYNIVVEDNANLLSEDEIKLLKTNMIPLTEFGNVMFITTDSSTVVGNSLKYVQRYYYSKFGNNNGVAFYIDMNGRQICACATGSLDDIITNGKCDTIMDNVYIYARNGRYFDCAKEVFVQMNTLLSGGKISESMKYICNGIVSIMLSLFLVYGLFILIIRNKKASKKELISECDIYFSNSPITVVKNGQRREYSPRSSSSSGGSSHHSSGRWWRIFW